MNKMNFFARSAVPCFFMVLLSVGALEASESAALSVDYAERVPARLGIGFMNTIFGWTALGVAPYQARQEGAGAGDAFARGVTHPFAHTFLGLCDLATFWVPGELGRSMAVPRHVWMPRPDIRTVNHPSVELPSESESEVSALASPKP